MVSEKVTVDLYKDSSIVECVFNMKNFGPEKTIEVGFPVMNFYHWQNPVSSETDKEKFQVWIGDKRVENLDIYIPKLEDRLAGAFDKTRKDLGNENKPWYLWKTSFNKNETLTIVVRYSLPSGATKTNRFFNYLLSTGADWKDKINRAEVIVNVKDFGMEQVLSISPKNYTIQGNQIMWDFKNIQPTTADDIFIKYETSKGAYQKEINEMQSKRPQLYIDNEKQTYNYMQDLKPEAIGKMEVVKTNPKYKNGEIFVYTKQYILKEFKQKLCKYNWAKCKKLANISKEDLEKNFTFIINENTVETNQIFSELWDINFNSISKIDIEAKILRINYQKAN